MEARHYEAVLGARAAVVHRKAEHAHHVFVREAGLEAKQLLLWGINYFNLYERERNNNSTPPYLSKQKEGGGPTCSAASLSSAARSAGGSAPPPTCFTATSWKE